jgi:hypothetical protein
MAGFTAPAFANEVLYTGGATPDGHGTFGNAFVLTAPGLNENVTINVNTQNLTGPAIDTIRVIAFQGNTDVTVDGGRSVAGASVNGAYITSTTGNISAIINGSMTSAGNGIVMDSRFAGDGGNLNLSGTGSLGNATNILAGAWLLTDIGTVTMNGLSSIQGGTYGILVNSNGTYSGLPGGDVNLGTTVALGTVTSRAGIGIEVLQLGNAFGDGVVNIIATNVNALGWGIHTLGWTASTNITASGTVESTTATGIYATSSSGNITASGNGTGIVRGADEGITLNAVTSGNTTVQNFASVTTSLDTGIWLLNGTGNASVNNVGTVTGALGDGILATTAGGNISVSNAGFVGGITGGGRSGVVATTAGNGTITVDNNGAITGTGGLGVWTTNIAGTQSINGNGAITGSALQGIAATSSTGAIGIGNTAFNGVITGATNGIQAASTTGNINVATNANVTGTGNIGIFTSTAGNTVNIIKAGNVNGGIWGMDTLAQLDGNITNTIAAGSTVSGGAIGLVTGTISGVSTTTNVGVITTTGDTGAAGSIGGLANSNVAGTNIVNNTGQVIGGVATAGLAYTMNNQAGGVWTPSANGNVFGSINDTVNNAGTINVRSGTTTFAGLEALNNQAGGHINLAYAPAATDNLTVFNFAPQAASSATFNFNAALANNSGLGFDNTGNGLGTADTIVVAGIVTAQAKSIINLVTTGTPASQTGSVALIYTGVNLTAPAVGATITPSSLYSFGTGAPAPGAIAYFLVDDGRGGVYLQWAPNTSAKTLGGYGGGVGPASASNPAGAIASGASGAAGIGGVGLTGGPGGGGAAGQVADMAAASALPFGSASQSGECARGRFVTAWGAIEGSKSTTDGGGSGSNRSLSGGVDADVSTALGLRCNQLALGAFAVAGDAKATWDSGSNDSTNTGVGGYVRASTSIGLYASLLGASSWADQSLDNNVLSANADRSATTYAVVGSVGFMTSLGATTAIDVRGFASFANTKGDGFTDSVGLTVTESRDEITTYGASIGLYQSFSPSVYGFVRGGVKWVDLDSSITAYTVTRTGNSNSTVGSFEAGLNGAITSSTIIGARGFTDVGDGLTNYGGKLDLTVKF